MCNCLTAVYALRANDNLQGNAFCTQRGYEVKHLFLLCPREQTRHRQVCGAAVNVPLSKELQIQHCYLIINFKVLISKLSNPCTPAVSL